MPLGASGAIDLTAASEFLKYGPLGLAGLMLVLVLVALITIKNLQKNQVGLLRLLLGVGTFCFVAASAAALLTARYDGSHTVEIYKARDARQMSILSNIAAMADASIPKLEQLSRGVSNGEGCPSGARGVAIPHGSEWAAISADVMSKLRGAKEAVATLSQ